jgi:hypothetical protein
MPWPPFKWLAGRSAPLKSRPGRVLAILTCLIIALVGLRLWPGEEQFYPQLRSAADAAPASIFVGENVHVSKPHEKIAFTECIITADPNRPNRLFASSIYFPHRDQGLAGYLSDDGGTTWTTSLELIADRGKNENLYDETAAFGPDGEVYFAHLPAGRRMP